MQPKHLQLAPRLQLLADLVPQGARLADIGTDHGYLPVWLLQQGRISSAIAADIGAGPLEHYGAYLTRQIARLLHRAEGIRESRGEETQALLSLAAQLEEKKEVWQHGGRA